ncbi:MAG: CopG family transcriptional regulator [Clostridium sp.]
MATKVVKDDVVRVRVTKEQKKKLKIIADIKKISMSEILSVATENEIKKFEEREKSYNKICDRAVATEKKIQELKDNLEKRKSNNKNNFWRK